MYIIYIWHIITSENETLRAMNQENINDIIIGR